jgi:hypothetical protein
MVEPSEQLRRFLRDYISSYEELEVLLLLAREPTRARTLEDVAASLNVPIEGIDLALQALLATGALLQSERRGDASHFWYAPADDELRQRVTELEHAYVEQRLAIIQIMSANAFERVRGATARRLAEAFRLERPKK